MFILAAFSRLSDVLIYLLYTTEKPMNDHAGNNSIRGIFRLCGKTGRIVGLNFKNRWAKWLFPITGLLALIWYLVRVLPKPSRAAYPCQRVAGTLALSSVAYWLSILAVFPALRHAKMFFRRNRYLLAGACLIVGLLCGALVLQRTQPIARASSGETPNAPIGTARGINPGRVTWSYDPLATLWSGNADGTHWWDPTETDQSRVDAMLSAGLQSLTSTTSDAAAWDALFRSFNERRGNGNISYQESPNQLIVIKINQNPTNQDNKNYYAKNGVDGDSGTEGNEYTITGSPHLILSLVKQLVAAGVAQSNIIITDPTGENRGWGGPRTIGDNIYDYVHASYSGVQFVDGVGMNGRELATWPSTNQINYNNSFSGENTSSGMRIAQQILDAGFLIDMALLKSHGDGPTLTFKNFYGAVSGQRHGTLYGNGTPTYYSNLIPLMGSSNLGQKVMLFMVDGLYGAPSPNAAPTKWSMSPFNGGWPASVFLSQDPCAIDSVGFDFLNAEYNLPQNTDYYIHEAASIPDSSGKKLSGYMYQADAGSSAYVGSLGVEEHWNNSTSKQYSRNLGTGDGIELVYLPAQPSTPLTLTPAAAAVTVVQGSSVKDAITANGATEAVTYAATSTGAGVTATVTGGVLTVTASATAKAAASTVTVTGTSGTSTASTVIAVTVTPIGCTPTAITPYLEVGTAAWQQTNVATVTSTTTVVNLGPQPLTGTWAWAGPNGFTAATRQINAIALSAGANVYTATYTNAAGCKSTQAFTITVSGGTGTAITPYVQVNGAAWQETDAATVAAGATVDLGPQPITGGTWSWTGPKGYTSTARQINDIPLSTGANVFVATYTNAAAVKSTETFTITVE
jgi:hypothetical protein